MVFLISRTTRSQIAVLPGSTDAEWDAGTGIRAYGFASVRLAPAEDGAIFRAVRQDTPFARRLAAFETGAPGLGPSRWRLSHLYRRGAMPASFIVEWDDEARHLHLVAKLADHEAEPHKSGLRRAG